MRDAAEPPLIANTGLNRRSMDMVANRRGTLPEEIETRRRVRSSLIRTWHLRLGHVAVVTKILNNREIVVEHANWLNRGEIHQSTPERDVSKANDWSAVRVWYTPGNQYVARTYPAHGFIHAEHRISALSLSRALDIPERGT